MSALVPFSSADYAVRTVAVNGEPWFVAADVCAALEIGNPSQAVSYLDDDEVTLTTDEGGRQLNIISEPGLYSLVLRSRKPEAKTFKRWITHDVIPAIRRTGAYVAADVKSPAQLISMLANELVAQEAALAEVRAETSLARHDAREAMELAEMAHAKIDRRHPDNPDLTPITPTTIGKRLTPPISGQAANQLLRAAGFQWWQDGAWTPTSDGRAYAVVEHGEHPDTGYPWTQLKWQSRIVPVLERRMARRVAIAGGAA